jgi:hypothetical protein
VFSTSQNSYREMLPFFILSFQSGAKLLDDILDVNSLPELEYHILGHATETLRNLNHASFPLSRKKDRQVKDSMEHVIPGLDMLIIRLAKLGSAFPKAAELAKENIQFRIATDSEGFERLLHQLKDIPNTEELCSYARMQQVEISGTEGYPFVRTPTPYSDVKPDLKSRLEMYVNYASKLQQQIRIGQTTLNDSSAELIKNGEEMCVSLLRDMDAGIASPDMKQKLERLLPAMDMLAFAYLKMNEPTVLGIAQTLMYSRTMIGGMPPHNIQQHLKSRYPEIHAACESQFDDNHSFFGGSIIDVIAANEKKLQR